MCFSWVVKFFLIIIYLKSVYRDILAIHPIKSVIKCMADQYTFQNLGQLSHTAGQIPFLYDKYNDHYRPINESDFGGGGSYTSKGRLKTSHSETFFFNTFQYGKETDIWDESTANGGSGIHDPNTNQIDMSVSQVSGSECIRQTYNVQRYVPSRNSNLAFAIKLENPTSGIRRRFGLFEQNDGIFFEDGGDGDYYCVIRSSVSGSVNEIKVARNDWNGDKLDGNGPSKIIANPQAQQLITIDYEWYGAGEIGFNYIINGQPRRIHTFSTANVFTDPWCRTPFLPIRVEIKNTSGGQPSGRYHLYQGSNSLTSEGNSLNLGVSESVSTSIAGTIVPRDIFYPLISLRLKSNSLKGVVFPRHFQVATTQNNVNVFYRIIRNATISGSVWQDLPDGNSFVQYDLSGTSYTGGQVVDNGFVLYGSSAAQIELDHGSNYQIGRSGMGAYSDIYTLAVAHSATADRNVIGSLTWIEQR